MNLNLSRISAETKISDLSKISADIWLRLETFHESGPRIFKGLIFIVFSLTLVKFEKDPDHILDGKKNPKFSEEPPGGILCSTSGLSFLKLWYFVRLLISQHYFSNCHV